MEYPFMPPPFLENQSADEIHSRMLNNLPANIDKSEGNVPWDFSRPPALEKAEFVNFDLVETIKLISPQWSYGKWADLHADLSNTSRREANKAIGVLSVTGVVGTVIPSGFQFATLATLTPGVLFAADDETVLNGTPNAQGYVTVDIDITAVEGGISGNVAPDTIKAMVKPITGIVLTSNANATNGGTPTESDESVIERILDAKRNGTSFTGNNADYIRWAKEIPAVGQVIVDPEWNDPNLPPQFHYVDTRGNDKCAGAVRLIIVDENGIPANQQILDAVYTHIMATGETDIKRLAPIGAHLTVTAPTSIIIDIAATIIIKQGETLSTVIQRFVKNLNDYWLTVAQETQDMQDNTGYVRWTQIGAVLDKTQGVLDYTGLMVNGGTSNIAITQSQYPVTGEVNLSE